MEGTFFIKHVGQVQSITNQKTGEQFVKYPQARHYGHNDLAAKACPCFRVAEEFPELSDMLPSK